MSVSNASSPRTPAWRIAVVVAVAALAAGIGVAVGTFLLSGRGGAVGAGASYVPVTAPFYAELRLEPSLAQDAALRDVLGRFPTVDGLDLAQPLYGQMGERLDELFAEEGTTLSWSADVAPWFDGRVGLAVLELPLDAMTESRMPVAPPMVVLVGVTDASAARASIERLIASSGDAPTFADQTHAGITIRVATDDQLLIAPRPDDIIAALDAHRAGAGVLAEANEIARIADALPADWLAFAVYDFTDLLAAAISEAATESPAMADAFGSLLEDQSLRGAVAIAAGGDRITIDAASDPPTGDLAVENADRVLAGEVPADALYYSEAGGLGAALAAMIGPMKEAVAAAPDGEEQVRTFEAALGADLEEMVSWIDHGAIVVGFDGSQPYGGLVLVPNDVEAAERRLGQLASFASLGGLDPSSGITVSDEEVGGATITTIRWESSDSDVGMLPIPTGVAIEYTVTDDRAIIGVGDAFVRRVLDLDESASLAAQPRFSEAIAELGGASNAGVAWLDLAGTRKAVETALGPAMAAMDADGSYEAEIRPWLLPLDRFVSVVRLEGDLLVQRTALLVE